MKIIIDFLAGLAAIGFMIGICMMIYIAFKEIDYVVLGLLGLICVYGIYRFGKYLRDTNHF